jgi:hypothetical protein
MFQYTAIEMRDTKEEQEDSDTVTKLLLIPYGEDDQSNLSQY